MQTKINKKSQLLSEFQKVNEHTNPIHNFDLNKKYRFGEERPHNLTQNKDTLSLNDLSSKKRISKIELQLLNSVHQKLHKELREARTIFKDEGITIHDTPKDFNAAIRKRLVKNAVDHAKIEQKELEIKIKQILQTTKNAKKLIEQYNLLDDILTSKIESNFRINKKLIDSRAEIFKRNVLKEITSILESTPSKNLHTALDRIHLIIIDW